MSELHDTKALVRRHIEEAVNQCRPEVRNDVMAEDDRVVVRYIERGAHTGDFVGLPPTGRTYEKHGFALYRIAGGQLAEAWLQEDDQGYQQQLFS